MVQVRTAMRQRAGSCIGVSGGRVQMGRWADGANQTRRAANEARTHVKSCYGESERERDCRNIGIGPWGAVEGDTLRSAEGNDLGSS
jgi:hypothetical protein